MADAHSWGQEGARSRRVQARKRIAQGARKLGWKVYYPEPTDPIVVSLVLIALHPLPPQVRYVEVVRDGDPDGRCGYLATGVIPCRVTAPSGVDEFLRLLADIERSTP